MNRWIDGSAADAMAVNPNTIKRLLAIGWRIFFIKGNPFFSNVPISFPRNHPECPILCNWVFDNSIVAEELFPKALKLLY